jgi:hypothetical protein
MLRQGSPVGEGKEDNDGDTLADVDGPPKVKETWTTERVLQ